MQPAPEPRGENLSALAEDLEERCRRMADGLAALEAEPSDSFESSALSRVEEMKLLQSQISAAAAGLGIGAPGRPGGRPWTDPDARLTEAARLLAQAAAACSRLAGRAALLRGEVGQRLLDLQRGARMLRSYGDAVRGCRSTESRTSA